MPNSCEHYLDLLAYIVRHYHDDVQSIMVCLRATATKRAPTDGRSPDRWAKPRLTGETVSFFRSNEGEVWRYSATLLLVVDNITNSALPLAILVQYHYFLSFQVQGNI